VVLLYTEISTTVIPDKWITFNVSYWMMLLKRAKSRRVSMDIIPVTIQIQD
jgi:hypothetical protein